LNRLRRSTGGDTNESPSLRGVRPGSLGFRLIALLWQLAHRLSGRFERLGERALSLSLFRAGSFLRHPLPQSVRIHPQLRARTTGIAIAALLHRVTPRLEESRLFQELDRRRSRLAKVVQGVAREPERAMPAGIALLLSVAVVASLLPGPTVDQRSLALDDGAAGLSVADEREAPPALWGSALDPDRNLIGVSSASQEQARSDSSVDPTEPSALGWRPIEAAREASADVAFGFSSDQLEAPLIYEDGIMHLPAAVSISIPDGRTHVSIHIVQKGQTLSQIAKLYGIEMMDVIWSNHLISTSNPPSGKRLKIPDVKGYVHVVSEHETMKSIASSAHISVPKIVAYNGLHSTDVVLGMVLVLPGGRGPALPTYAASGMSWAYNGPLPALYSGMTFRYPVPGGRFVRGFFRGHDGMDIAQGVGAPILAAAAGVVVRTGWYDNCGGNQVVIAVGSNLYTGYYHMSKILVSTGQKIARGQQIGKIGDSGCTTGPHLHFSVSRGFPLASGSTFYNPARFLP